MPEISDDATREPTVIYTDGACSGNPGPGGWAWVTPAGDWASGSENPTTNQRMEVAAVLDALDSHTGPVEIHSDSTYVVNCFRDRWWEGWLKRDWKNSAKKPVANRDLWEPLIAEYRRRVDAGIETSFSWVKGHSGDVMNDRADELAVAAGADQRGRQTGDAASSVDSASPDAEAASSAQAKGEPGGAPAGHRVVVGGHRPPEIGGWEYPNPTAEALVERLAAILSAKAELHADLVVVTGLGLGAEQLAAVAAAQADIPYVAVLAFPDPSAVWPAAAQKRFDELVDNAADVVVRQRAVPDTKAKIGAALQRRDAWLAEIADEAIVVWDGQERFIGQLVRRFETSVGDDVWIVNPNDLA